MKVWVVYCFTEKGFWGIHSVMESEPTKKQLQILKVNGCFDSVRVEQMTTEKRMALK